jgi:hypothetical protein
VDLSPDLSSTKTRFLDPCRSPFQELNNTFFMCACLQIGDPLPRRHEEHADPAVRRIMGWIDGDTLVGELRGF